jgi:hypothetical protein
MRSSAIFVSGSRSRCIARRIRNLDPHPTHRRRYVDLALSGRGNPGSRDSADSARDDTTTSVRHRRTVTRSVPARPMRRTPARPSRSFASLRMTDRRARRIREKDGSIASRRSFDFAQDDTKTSEQRRRIGLSWVGFVSGRGILFLRAKLLTGA